MTFNDLIPYIIVFILIVLLYIIFHLPQNGTNEHMTPQSNEAVQDVASLYNTGNMTVSNLTVTGSFNMLPTGVIVAWSGSSIPQGWTLCDGTNGSPDLRGRFIVGTGQGAGLTNRKLGDVGGEENHTLTISEMPAHSHGLQIWGDWAGSASQTNQWTLWLTDRQNHLYQSWTNQSCNGNNSQTKCDKPVIITDTGGSQPHNNMPPFYALAFIMKL
jgi:microcystin-dependent protein